MKYNNGVVNPADSLPLPLICRSDTKCGQKFTGNLPYPLRN
jgi:hypothetical protein